MDYCAIEFGVTQCIGMREWNNKCTHLWTREKNENFVGVKNETSSFDEWDRISWTM